MSLAKKVSRWFAKYTYKSLHASSDQKPDESIDQNDPDMFYLDYLHTPLLLNLYSYVALNSSNVLYEIQAIRGYSPTLLLEGIAFFPETEVAFFKGKSLGIYAIDLNSKKRIIDYRNNFMYNLMETTGIEEINGSPVLGFEFSNKIIRECDNLYFSRSGELCFNHLFLSSDYSKKSYYTEIFGETVIESRDRKETYSYFDMGGKRLYHSMELTQRFIFEGIGYLFGRWKDRKGIPIYNAVDRNGNLFSGYGGPFADVHKLSYDLLSDPGKNYIIAKKNMSDDYAFYDKEGNMLDIYGGHHCYISEFFTCEGDTFLLAYHTNSDVTNQTDPSIFHIDGTRYDGDHKSHFMAKYPMIKLKKMLDGPNKDISDLIEELKPSLENISWRMPSRYCTEPILAIFREYIDDIPDCRRRVLNHLVALKHGVLYTYDMIEREYGLEKIKKENSLFYSGLVPFLYDVSCGYAARHRGTYEDIIDRARDMQKSIKDSMAEDGFSFKLMIYVQGET